MSWRPSIQERNDRSILDAAEHHANHSESEPEAETVASSEEPLDKDNNPIAAALQHMMLQRRTSTSSDNPYSDFSIGHRSGYYSSSDDATGGDLTACDKECGYCGRCDY